MLPPCRGCFPSRGYAANPYVYTAEIPTVKHQRAMVKIVVSPIFITMSSHHLWDNLFTCQAIRKLIAWTWNSTTR
ncbi:hypothetical protein HA466_0104070 [Hirschfeldia incana]|nr:hypothetical protein HA466_0104070 [Hirschfeldia incana]